MARFLSFQRSIRESLFRNVGLPYRNLMGLGLGLTASLLPLASSRWTTQDAAVIFVGALVLIMILLPIVRPSVERDLDRFAWGLLAVIILGFGLGALLFQARGWWIWLWRQYLRINEPHELVLEFLFLLGVILGVFVVRNWAKEQKAFTESLSGVLGGTFVAAIFGDALKGQGLTPMQALTYYGLGFTMSAAVNLLIAARLTANYTNKQSITSRAILDFLYGSERTNLIDGYFLKNFTDDPDYAKRWLIDTLDEFRNLMGREFAERMDLRRRNRERRREAFKANTAYVGTNIKQLTDLRRSLDPGCSKRRTAEEKLQELQYEKDSLTEVPAPRNTTQEKRLQEIEKEINALTVKIAELKNECDDQIFPVWEALVEGLNQLKPSYYYELLAIECEEDEEETDDSASQGSVRDRQYSVVYKYLGPDNARIEEESEMAQQDRGLLPFITEKMFRIGVAARWQDTLEYISASGAYRAAFPYFGSVSGLALLFRQTIIMDRDINKRFRSKAYPNGICPMEIEQSRGLDEIDFLSYIAIPIVSRLGSPTENSLGVITIDTKLFVVPFKLEGQPVKASEGIFRIRLTPKQLTEYASNLYDPDDQDVEYLKDLTKIIVPVVELYSKCRVGAL